jgi:hypothetical protein
MLHYTQRELHRRAKQLYTKMLRDLPAERDKRQYLHRGWGIVVKSRRVQLFVKYDIGKGEGKLRLFVYASL